ncbi:MAG: hypothetical protein HY537_18335 [Deltaproteobacteria bacterium]|nr:hypothetical protein [Deltaproteobacteria bacterium]
MLLPWQKGDLPDGVKVFLWALALVLFFVQSTFGLLFASVPAYLFQQHWWPAFYRYLNGKFSPSESAFILFLFGAIGLIFFALGLALFFIGARSVLRHLTQGMDDFLVNLGANEMGTIERLRKRPRSKGLRQASPSQSLFAARQPDGTFQVSTRASYRMVAGIIFFFTVLWNGFIGFGFIDLLDGSTLGMLFSLFLIPFLLVGLGLIVLTVCLFLASLYPSLKLKLEKDQFRRGDILALHWSFEHKPVQLRTLEVSLQVVETFIEGSGEDQSRHTQPLHQAIMAAHLPLKFQKDGIVHVTLPTHLEPSSSDAEREVSWILYVRARASRLLPDLRFWLPIVVR